MLAMATPTQGRIFFRGNHWPRAQALLPRLLEDPRAWTVVGDGLKAAR
jgi:hypothetical protein